MRTALGRREAVVQALFAKGAIVKDLIPVPTIGDVIQCCDPTCKHEATVTMFQTVRFNHGESVDCAECHGYDVQRKPRQKGWI